MAATAAALGVLCTLVTILLFVLVRHMIWVRREPGLFRCKIRVTNGWLAGYSFDWPKRTNRAVWARDVLILFRGIGRVQMRALPVARAQGDVHILRQDVVSRLGTDPLAVHLVLDDGSRLEVAAPAKARGLLCGPYLVLQVRPNRGPQTSR
ncbi:MAG TPA: hypothetical protein VE441_14130 [Mycobacterium sp.]|jgi:hypothetical protein|nr:hypothetical protein [Mycobacterium sp.]